MPAIANTETPSVTDLTLDALLSILLRAGVLDAAGKRDLEIKANAQTARLTKERGKRYDVWPAELIASLKLQTPAGEPLDEERIAQHIAEVAQLPLVKIDPLKLDADLIAQTLPQPFARKFAVLVLKRDPSKTDVTVADPYNRELLEGLKRSVGVVQLHVSPKSGILKAITEVYGFRKSVQAAARDASPEQDAAASLQNLEQLVRMRTRTDEIDASDRHIVNAVEYLMHYAFDQKASDIHIEPKREQTIIRFRIDGVLHEVSRIPRAIHPPFVARIKTLCRMDIAEKRRPQDGRIKLTRAGDEVEIRVSSLPVAFGEKLVLRIFDPESLVGSLLDLGFPPKEFELFSGWLGRPHGLILITGPTGSGKTTTLYTALKSLSDQTLNVTSVEDPIEMVFENFNQVAVQPKIDLDFATVLRTLLRQDPDVIMVGEIRDQATAEMAVQAALTGHLLLSTLHTNDAPSAVTRLLDLDVPPFLIGSTVVGIMAQRLLRKICANCNEEASLSEAQVVTLKLAPGHYPVRVGKGCTQCRGTGHKGRTGIFELLDMTHETRALITAETDVFALRKVAQQQGLSTLRESAIRALLAGHTSFDEVVATTAAD